MGRLGAAGAGADVAGFGDIEDGGGVAAVDCARGGNYRVKISSSSGELDINRFSSRAGAGASGATGAAHSYWRERRRTSAGSRPAISDLQTRWGSFLKCSGQVSIKSCSTAASGRVPFRSNRTMLASISPMGMTAAMLIVEMAWLRRLGKCPSQIALAIAEVAIASSRGVIRRDPVGRYAVTRGSCAPDWRPAGWHMAACTTTGSAELLFAAAHRTETVEVRGEGGDGNVRCAPAGGRIA